MAADGMGARDASRQYLSFVVAEEQYAIELLKVREILRYETITRVPRMPTTVRGVINVRGNVVPVVDLGVKFGLPPSEVTKWSCIVILEVATDDDEASVMGVLADAVDDVVELAAEDVRPPPAFGTRVSLDFLAGMAQAGSRFLLVLDIDRVLSADEIHLSGELQDPDADIEMALESALSEVPPPPDAEEEGASAEDG